MRLKIVLSLVTFFMAAFTVAVWTEPKLSAREPEVESSSTPEVISGKIASIGDATFRVDVMVRGRTEALDFFVDDATTIQGRLRVGAQTTVQFREDAGDLIATHIRVQPAASR